VSAGLLFHAVPQTNSKLTFLVSEMNLLREAVKQDFCVAPSSQILFLFLGSPVSGGKEPKHEGHQVHKGGKRADFTGVFPS
jgi:hypothetical protein